MATTSTDLFARLLRAFKKGLVTLAQAGFIAAILPVLYAFELFRPVRIRDLRTDRIGGLIGGAEVFLRRKQLGLLPDGPLYLFIATRFIANEFAVEMCKRHINVIVNPILARLYPAIFPVLRRTRFFLPVNLLTNDYVEFLRGKPALSFTEDEERRGREMLRQMGIGPDDWFVCFHSRDPAYLEKAGEWSAMDWSYHDYRDCSVESYLKAAKYISSQGGFAIRVGAIVDKPLPELADSRIVDYATRFREPFMDIYLAAKCKFFLGNTAGLFVAAQVFDRPVACANFVPIDASPFGKNSFMIYKKIWSNRLGRHLSYPEAFELGLGKAYFSKQYLSHDLRCDENTDEEILDFAVEVNEILDKKREVNPQTQEAFLSLVNKYASHIVGTPVVMGSSFILKNSGLFQTKNA